MSIPEKIGPYLVETLLNKGGMSYLYLGSHPDTQEPVAIKVLSQKYISNPEVVQRFLNEAEIIAIANHPNIIKLYGHGEWEGGLYIAMEYIEGVSLRTYMLENPISLKRALKIIIDVAYALCHLHTHDVIHRDLKPENILVTEEGSIKVIDFGIAQLLTEKGAPGQPSRQRFIGTPIYISPEQKEDPESVSYPSDIYSLGIIAYELILGKLSHGQIHLSLMPAGIQPILHRCLQPDPAKRYQDIVDFITEVSAYLNSPALQKEGKIGDKLCELVEEFQIMHSKIIPSKPLNWKNIEIEIAGFKDFKAPAIYCDFIKLSKNSYGIILGEPSAKGGEGLIAAASFRGICRALLPIHKKPLDLVKNVNELLLNDPIGLIANFNYIILNPKENLITYLSLGYGSLWCVPLEKEPVNLSLANIKIGAKSEIEAEEISLPWNPGDILIVNNVFCPKDSPSKAQEVEKVFIKAIKENISSAPKVRAINVLRKLRIVSENFGKIKQPLLIWISRS